VRDSSYGSDEGKKKNFPEVTPRVFSITYIHGDHSPGIEFLTFPVHYLRQTAYLKHHFYGSLNENESALILSAFEN